MTRKIITLCVTVLLFFSCSYTVFAEDFDPSKRGSVSVTLINQNEAIVNAELSVYYVASAALNAKGNLIYNYTKDFEQLDTPIDDASLTAKLGAFVSERSVPSVKMITDAQGTALCNELPAGLYFVKQTGNVEGFAPCTPFIVTVPSVNDGEYVYEVNASPKTDVARLTSITVKKVWNTDEAAKTADSVTVQLLQGGNVVKTAILNEQNNWQVTYTDMAESDAYSINETDVPEGFTATYSSAGDVFTVTNTSTLIQTGQLTWPIPVLAIIGMLLIAAGVVLLQKKRETND